MCPGRGRRQAARRAPWAWCWSWSGQLPLERGALAPTFGPFRWEFAGLRLGLGKIRSPGYVPAMGNLWSYWGYAALAVAIFGLVRGVALVGTIILAVAAFGYFVFWIPLWCGAANRQEGTFCRRNSHGLMMGCSLRQHKWQKFKGLWYKGRWRKLNEGLWTSPNATIGSASGLIALATFGWGLVLYLLH